MKKIIMLGTLLALSASAFAAGDNNLYMRFGFDLDRDFDRVGYGEHRNRIGLNNGDGKDTAWGLYVEGTRNITPNFELGLGIGYEDHGKVKTRTFRDHDDNQTETYDFTAETELPTYTSVPLYAVLKYNFPASDVLNFYIKGNLGYSFNSKSGSAKIKYDDYELDKATGTATHDIGTIDINSSVKDGAYFGLGFGVEYYNFDVDLMWMTNCAELKMDYDDGTVSYRSKQSYDVDRITLGFGYRFNF